MPELDQLARPVVRRPARFHADQAPRQLGEERQDLRPPQRPANGYLALCVDRVNLKSALGQIEADRANLHLGWLPYPSPLQSLSDAPSAYLDADGRPTPGAEFLRLVPATWDETRGIAGKWGRWIAVARRSGTRWFVGVMTNETSRTVTLPLEFLIGGRWHVRALIDGRRPTDVVAYEGRLTASGTLGVPLAASGGAVLVLNPE